MRARDRSDIPAGAGAAFGLHRGVVAIDGRSEGERLERFASHPPGTYAWTRDADGAFWLGRITGPLRRDETAAAAACGLQHVRDASWAPHPVPPDEVPDEVRRSFARGGLNLQRVRAADGARTAALWHALTGAT
jgi:hypothetical protein